VALVVVKVLLAPHTLLVVPLATVMPATRVSLKPTPVRGTVADGLLMVKFRLVVPFSATVDDPNTLLIVGGATTVMLAVPGELVPASVEVTVTEFIIDPAAVPVTATETTQELVGLAAASVPPVSLTELTVVLGVPLHVLLSAGVLAMTRPVGRVSVKARPLSEKLFGLVMVRVSVVLVFRGMVAFANALAMEGGVPTVTDAEAVRPVPPLPEVTAPVTLFFCPLVAPVTVTTMVHDPLAAMVPPVSVIRVTLVLVIAREPVLHAEEVAVVAVRPDGNVSVKPTPVRETVFPDGLEMVMVREVVPLSAMLLAPNALEICGGATTVRVAMLLVVPVPPSFEVTAPVVLD